MSSVQIMHKRKQHGPVITSRSERRGQGSPLFSDGGYVVTDMAIAAGVAQVLDTQVR